MKITISVIGRFWAFNLANELHRRGHLRRLITTYPKFETVKWGIPRSQTVSHLPIELFNRTWNRAPSRITKRWNAQLCIHNWTDLMASTRIPTDTDVFVGWSSVSLWSLRKAKECGAVTVLERGSSHMRYQTRILQEEYDRLGMKGLMVHPGVYEKELQEYEEVDYIAIPSGFVKGTFLGEGISEDRLLHVPFGVNLSEFRPLPKEDGVFRVIHCGGLTVRKGVHYLLQAFSELKLPDAELWLIGSMSDEVKEFLRRFDNGKVFHRGPYPQKDLHRYYSQGSVFCLASIEEGLAMVILQAMACGLPIICTHNTGGGDIVRDGRDGFVVPIRDVESLKEKLIYLYENPKARESMGESARERVQGNFSWSHYGERTVRLYSNILNRRMEKSSRSANERDRLAGKALDRAPTEG